MTIVIDSDAHRTDTLANMRYGVATARRGVAHEGPGGEHAHLEAARQAAQALAR